ncbi:MAG TPA: hypothetical protein DDZ62_07435 [Delftia acidovorans]|nr:hypothetical protein [Delftia acidovorans]
MKQNNFHVMLHVADALAALVHPSHRVISAPGCSLACRVTRPAPRPFGASASAVQNARAFCPATRII